MANAGVSVDIDTEGIAVLIRYLRKVEPDLARILPREMRHVAKPVVQTARELVPQPTALSNWGPWTLARSSGGDRSWTSKARTGIVAQTDVRAFGDRNQINLLSLFQKDAAGAIYENAGRHPQADSARGRAFIKNLNTKHGESPRYLWPAVAQNLGYLNAELQSVVDKWAKTLEENLDRAA